MLRTTLCASSALLFAGISSAQQAPHARTPVKVPVAVKNAGTYHVATGTWTRSHGTAVQFGISDNIYSNTAQSGYYDPDIGPLGAAALGQLIDDGAIPGTTNPTVFANGGATIDINQVTEIQFAYCDLDPTARVAGWTLDFYEDYAPCTFPPPAPVGTVVLTGFPSTGCWISTVDLTNATGIGAEFPLQADGGAAAPGYDADPALDSFGYSYRYTGTGVSNAGIFITGDPAVTDTGWLAGRPNSGSNTYFGETGGCPGTGSGYGNDDSNWLEDTFNVGGLPAGSACYFFGGYANNGSSCGGPVGSPHAGYWMEISLESITSNVISTPGCVGAVTSTGSPANCVVTGSLNPLNNDAQLTATGLPQNEFGIFATGLAVIPPMTVNSGNGWICINPGALGGLGRFQGANQIKNSGANGTITLDTLTGEWSLSSIPTSTGTYAAMAGLTSNFQAWFRDQVGLGYNFSGSCAVTW